MTAAPVVYVPPPPLWGVWVCGFGWVKTIKGVISFAREDTAREAARRLHGEVRLIDDSLVDLEQSILQIEAQDAARKGFRQWLKIKW